VDVTLLCAEVISCSGENAVNFHESLARAELSNNKSRLHDFGLWILFVKGSTGV